MHGIGSQCIVQQTPQNAQEERGVRMVCGLEGGDGMPYPLGARINQSHCCAKSGKASYSILPDE